MSTDVTAADAEPLYGAMKHLRSEESGVESYLIVHHQNDNPNVVELHTQGEGLQSLANNLDDGKVQYALVKMHETFDMSTTTKFIYIHWIGEKVPFVKKGRYGVVHGSVMDQFFRPTHIDIETSSLDDVTLENITRLISDNSGTKSKVLENTEAEARPKRGFTSTPTTQPPKAKGHVIPVSSQGAEVKHGQDVIDAIMDVRSDESGTRWACIGYTENNVKQPLMMLSCGQGGIDELKQCLDDDKGLYFLYRTTDVVDGHTTVKFVYIAWVGEYVKPMAKAKISTHKGVVEEIFSGAHVTLFVTDKRDLTESLVIDKVQSASGTKSNVK